METPKVLFLGATHGDEHVGVRALCTVSEHSPHLEWMIGNPPAYRANTRIYGGDLNRSAPGSPYAEEYAPRRAWEILEKAKNYDWCVDIHGTTAKSGIFIILTKLTRENLLLALRFDIKRIVYWPSFSSELSGPLSEYFPCGLEIECGPKDDPQVESELVEKIQKFLKEKEEELLERDAFALLQTRELFVVTGSSQTAQTNLEEFTEAQIDNERKIPLLVGQYAAQGIACYLMDRAAPSDWWKKTKTTNERG